MKPLTVMKSQPTRGDVHVNRPLTNISIAFFQATTAFVADLIFPNIPVTKKSDVYFTYDRGFFNRDEMIERAPATEAQGGGYALDADANYLARVYAYRVDIPDEVRDNADSPINLDREATLLATHKALIKRERLWVTKYFVTGIWTFDYDGVTAAPGANEFLQWDQALSTPIENIRAAKTRILKETGFEPNTFVMGQEVWDVLQDHPDIIARVNSGQTPNGPAMVTREVVAQILELNRIVIMKSIYNTAKEGATNSHDFIGGKNALLVYSAPNPGILTPSAGYTFSWTGRVGAGANGSRIKRIRMENIEADRIEIQMAFDQKLVSADLGQFFESAVA